jgi:predicted DNA-binding transcriptional regulator AlpA
MSNAIPIDYATLPDAARLREKHVIPLIGRSRASLWRDVRKGLFPAPKKHGAITSWKYGDVKKWLAAQEITS